MFSWLRLKAPPLIAPVLSLFQTHGRLRGDLLGRNQTLSHVVYSRVARPSWFQNVRRSRNHPAAALPWTGCRSLEACRLTVRMISQFSNRSTDPRVNCALGSHAVSAGHFIDRSRPPCPEERAQITEQLGSRLWASAVATFVVGAAGGRSIGGATSPNTPLHASPLRGSALATCGLMLERMVVALGTCSAQLFAELRTS
jgi:hypothetical protein